MSALPYQCEHCGARYYGAGAAEGCCHGTIRRRTRVEGGTSDE